MGTHNFNIPLRDSFGIMEKYKASSFIAKNAVVKPEEKISNGFANLEEAACYNIPNIQRINIKKWKNAAPVRYRRVKNYLPHEAAVATLLKHHLVGEKTAQTFFADILTGIGTPTWWVGMEIGKSLLQTSLPPGVSIQTAKLPLAHFAMLIPNGLLPYGESDFVALLCFGYLNPDDVKNVQGLTSNPQQKDPLNNVLDSLENWSSPFHNEQRMFGLSCVYGWTFKGCAFDSHPSPTADLDGLNIRAMHEEDKTTDDRSFSTLIHSFVLNCAFVIANRPDLVEGLLNNSNKTLQIKEKDNSLASPRWIGRNYKRRISSFEKVGTHQSPVMHWRRGHWRNQPIGAKELKQRKFMWIEPILVGSVKNDV